MREALVLAWLAGCTLGGMYFGGLWWTVRRGLSAERPALWFMGSLLLRLCVVLSGFYLAAGAHWERFLACLLGFVTATLVVRRLSLGKGNTPRRSEPEGTHAPHAG
jgi:F1F0 ATPase subunit 2